jgi:signal peptidase II
LTDPQSTSAPALWRHFLALFVVAILVGADLYSKAKVMPWLEARMVEYADFHGGYPMPEPDLQRDSHGHQRHPVVGNWLAGMHNLNYGAAFGQGGGLQKILVPGRCVAVLVLGFLIIRAPRKRRVYLSALVLVAAGAIGNTFDNLFYKPHLPAPGKPFGPVRDFIDVYFEVWDWHFATFNVADACISVGVVLLLISTFTAPKSPEADSTAESSPLS